MNRESKKKEEEEEERKKEDVTEKVSGFEDSEISSGRRFLLARSLEILWTIMGIYGKFQYFVRIPASFRSLTALSTHFESSMFRK